MRKVRERARRVNEIVYFHPATPSFWLGLLTVLLLVAGRRNRHGEARFSAAWSGTLVGLGGSVLAVFELAQENEGGFRIRDILSLLRRLPSGEVVSLRKRAVYLAKHLPFLLVANRIFRDFRDDARLVTAGS